MRDEVDFLPVHMQKSNSIALRVQKEAFPKHPKEQVCNIVSISQEKHEG